MNSDILHIGVHKTGSTYLQNVIWPQVRDVQYLSRPFTQHNHAFNVLQYADDTFYDPQDVRSVVAEFGDKRFIVSDEALSGKPLLFASINRSQIARRLSAIFPDATIVLFIRDQRDIILSHYNSYVKEPIGTKTLREFVWKPGPNYEYEAGIREHQHFDPMQLYFNTSDFHLHLDSFRYVPLIALYRSLFKHVEVLLFEELKFRPEVVVQRLSDLVQQPLTAGSKEWNRSYTSTELVIRRTLNRVRPVVDSDVLVKGASRLLGTVLPGGNKDRWRREIEQIVGDYYSRDNQRLKAMCPDLPWERYEDKYI